jgi:hypothetical protein
VSLKTLMLFNPQVMELSENLKFRSDPQAGDNPQDRSARASAGTLAATADPGQAAFSTLELAEDAESQMRKALGLLGETSRHRSEPDRADPQGRVGGGFNGGLHRRRFVQDGDVPVTVLRRDQGHEQPIHRSVAAAVAPTTSRLQRTEAALAAETAARDKAERHLSETQAIVRDLQTKIGHAELAKNEAVEALRAEREQAAQYHAAAEAIDARLHDAEARAQAAEDSIAEIQEQLHEERQARKAAEKALRGAEAAREVAEQLVRTLSEELPAPPRPTPARTVVARPAAPSPVMVAAAVPVRTDRGRPEPARAEKPRPETPRRAKPMAEPEVVAATARRGRATIEVAAEPEPVKWWLNSKPVAKKR